MKEFFAMQKKLGMAAVAFLLIAWGLRILIPVSVMITFSILLLAFLIKENWGKIRPTGRIIGALVVFVILWFLSSQALRLYPIDAYNAWATGGGFNGVFWGHVAPFIPQQMLLMGFIAFVVWGCLRKKTAAIIAAAALGAVILWQAFLPPLALPAGLKKVTAAGTITRVCGQSQVTTYDYEDSDVSEIDLLLSDKSGCLSQSVTLPFSFTEGFDISFYSPKGMKAASFSFLCPLQGSVVTLRAGHNPPHAMNYCYDPNKDSAPRFFAGGTGIVVFRRAPQKRASLE